MKNHTLMKNYLKTFNARKSSAGFTLIELLVAASITTVVMTAAGFGLSSIMSADRTASAETNRRVELNRALEFIDDEVRQANAINRIPAPVASQPDAATVEAGTVQSILVLDIPGVSAGPVVYHIAQPKSTTPWLGPRAIYRWGPNLNNNGDYTDPSVTAGWTNHAVVDLVEDARPNPNPVCSNSWVPSPGTPNRRGFYACIDPTRRIAELHLLGRVTKALGNSTTYEVGSKAFARANGAGGAVGAFGLGGPGGVPGVPPGVLVPAGPVTASYRVIGGSITCGAGGVTLPTKTSVSIDNGASYTQVSASGILNLPPLDSTNRVIVRGNLTTNACGSINTTHPSTNTTQVKALRNGDPVPSVQAFGNQTTIDAYLREYIDPATNKISIADNEVIYLYEMGSTNPSDASFDLQDIVVLATVEPR